MGLGEVHLFSGRVSAMSADRVVFWKSRLPG
jgi:hypothetical protein